jgi:hypothetical protein
MASFSAPLVALPLRNPPSYTAKPTCSTPVGSQATPFGKDALSLQLQKQFGVPFHPVRIAGAPASDGRSPQAASPFFSASSLHPSNLPGGVRHELPVVPDVMRVQSPQAAWRLKLGIEETAVLAHPESYVETQRPEAPADHNTHIHTNVNDLLSVNSILSVRPLTAQDPRTYAAGGPLPSPATDRIVDDLRGKALETSEIVSIGANGESGASKPQHGTPTVVEEVNFKTFQGEDHPLPLPATVTRSTSTSGIINAPAEVTLHAESARVPPSAVLEEKEGEDDSTRNETDALNDQLAALQSQHQRWLRDYTTSTADPVGRMLEEARQLREMLSKKYANALYSISKLPFHHSQHGQTPSASQTAAADYVTELQRQAKAHLAIFRSETRPLVSRLRELSTLLQATDAK